MKKTALAYMENSQSGIVTSIRGGRGVAGRLESLGIRPGAKITKKSALLGGGPVIANVGNAEIAIGYGMALKILVEVEGR